MFNSVFFFFNNVSQLYDNVSPASKVCRIGDNLTAQAAIDLTRRPDTSLGAHVLVNLMGSM